MPQIDDHIEEHLNGRRSDEPPPEYPISSQLEGELRELRVRFANTRYRVLYQRSDNLVALLHVIEKDTGAVPVADVELAKRRMKGQSVRSPTASTASRRGFPRSRHPPA